MTELSFPDICTFPKTLLAAANIFDRKPALRQNHENVNSFADTTLTPITTGTRDRYDGQERNVRVKIAAKIAVNTGSAALTT